MSQVHVLLGKCYQGQKEPEKAKAEFLAAINPDRAAAQPHYLLAKVYRELHDQQASAAELAQFERLSKLDKDKTLQRSPQDSNQPSNNFRTRTNHERSINHGEPDDHSIPD